jgi:hypothetical protein
MSFSDGIQDLATASKYVKMLVHGDPKTGKTVFAATAPKPLILDVERGTRSLTDAYWGNKFSHVKVVPLNSMNDLRAAVTAARAGELAAYETLVLDTLTEFEDRTLAAYMRYAVSKNSEKNPYNPEWPEYKAVTGMIREQLIQLRDIDKHIIFITHSRNDADKSRGGMAVERPDIMPKLAASLTGMVDVIGYTMAPENGVYKMRIVPTFNIIAGSRIKFETEVLENPSFDMFQLESMKGLQ